MSDYGVGQRVRSLLTGRVATLVERKPDWPNTWRVRTVDAGPQLWPESNMEPVPSPPVEEGTRRRWWIATNGPEYRYENCVLGPFDTAQLAFAVRVYVERAEAPMTYWVVSEPVPGREEEPDRCVTCGRTEEEAHDEQRETFAACPCPDGYSTCPMHGPDGEGVMCDGCGLWGFPAGRVEREPAAPPDPPKSLRQFKAEIEHKDAPEGWNTDETDVAWVLLNALSRMTDDERNRLFARALEASRHAE